MHLSYKSMQSVEPILSFTRLLCSGLLFLIPPILQRLLITHSHDPKPASIPSAGSSLGNHWESVAHSNFFLSGSAMPWELPLGPCSSALSHGIVSVMNFLFDFCLFLSYWHHNSALKTRKFRIWFWWFCELTLLTLTLFIPNLCNTQLSFLHF